MGVFYAFLLLGLAIGLPLALPLLLVDLLSARLLQPLLALALKVPGLLSLVGSLLLLPGLLQNLQIPVQLLPAVVVAAPAVLALLPASAFQSLLRVPLPSGGGPPRRRVACCLVSTRFRRARRLALPRGLGCGLPPGLFSAPVGLQPFQRPPCSRPIAYRLPAGSSGPSRSWKGLSRRP